METKYNEVIIPDLIVASLLQVSSKIRYDDNVNVLEPKVPPWALREPSLYRFRNETTLETKVDLKSKSHQNLKEIQIQNLRI